MDIAGAGAAALTQKAATEAEEVTGIHFSSISVQQLLDLAVTFGISFLVIWIVLKILDRVQKLSHLDDTVKSFIRSTVKAGLWIIAIGILLGELNINSTTYAAIVSIVGLALSLSLQGTPSNMFSGMTILTTKPFTAGDWVEIGEVAGTVTRVELFYTIMLTAENKTIFIPNSEVAGATVVNYSRQHERRIELKLGVDYEAPTELVKTALLDAARADERILTQPEPFAGLLSYQESAVEFVLYVWAKTEDYWNVYFSLTERVRKIFHERGISIAYNHLDVHILGDKK